jgi:hypothetical protein
VPLRDISALDEWGRHDDPPYSIWRIVSLWVEGLGSGPWQAPSAPFPELSALPDYEVRVAEVPESNGVEVFYRREFASEVVDFDLGGTAAGLLTARFVSVGGRSVRLRVFAQ